MRNKWLERRDRRYVEENISKPFSFTKAFSAQKSPPISPKDLGTVAGIKEKEVADFSKVVSMTKKCYDKLKDQTEFTIPWGDLIGSVAAYVWDNHREKLSWHHDMAEMIIISRMKFFSRTR